MQNGDGSVAEREREREREKKKLLALTEFILKDLVQEEPAHLIFLISVIR
jgi:hypothetical protein